MREKPYLKRSITLAPFSDLFRLFGRLIYRFGHTDSDAQNVFSSFLFSVVFQQKISWSSDNDYSVYLIVSKWLRRQKFKQNRITVRQKEVEAKEETVYESVFIHLDA